MEESLARKSLLGTAMNILGALIAYVGFFFIARRMPSGEQVIGLVAFSTGYVSVFLPLSRLGFATAHSKKVSEGADMAECNGAFTLITVLLTLVMTAVAFGSVVIWTYVLHRGFQSVQEIDAIWIMLGYTVITALSSIPTTTFNARREVAKGQIGAFVGHIVRVSAIIVIVIAGLAALDIIWAYFFGSLASLVASFFFFRSYPVRWPSRGILREYAGFANPLLVQSVISPLPLSLAPVFVQLFWSLTYTGYFGSAFRIVAVLTAVGSSVSNVIFPKLSELHSKGQALEIRERTADSEKFLAFVLAPIAFFIVVYAPGVIHVMLKDNFLPATASMVALALYVYVSGVSGPKILLIPALNRPRLSGNIGMASSLLTIVLLIVLIPTSVFGVPFLGLKDYGASIALLAGSLATYAVSNRYSNRIAGTRFEPRMLLFPLLALLSCIAVMPLTFLFPQLDWTWYIGLGIALVSALIFVLMSLVTKTIRPGEIRLLIDAVNPFAMHRYVRSELYSGYGDEKEEKRKRQR